MSRARFVGAIVGGLVAGLGLTVLLVAGERNSGTPSELADLERTAGRKLGIEVPAGDALPDAREQAIIQAGHLALSAAAGAAFAVTTDDDSAILLPGATFGVAFYAAMHWIAGPLLGLKPPEWRAGTKTIAMHAANHIGFGIVTAAGARLAIRR